VKAILLAERVSGVRAVGTSALRDAVNGSEFAARVHSETGMSIEIINGQEEARAA
jgi:exopolyphosphatase/guanosine-5'-triphosphate,3'-diphosphate pyrophosphatase